MIETKQLAVRRDRADVAPTTLKLEAGRHALLGRRDDGVRALLACMGGEVRPRRGSIAVLGGDPWAPAVRARVGWIPLDLRLPDVLRVDETIALARRVRKNAPISPASVLDALGVGALAGRRCSTLDAGESRAVALAEALASPTVSVVLIEEPFVSMAPPAVAALPAQLAAKKNACIVVATASAFDASRVADDFAVFDGGRLVRIVTEAPLRTGRERPRVRVVASDVRALAAALAKRPDVEHLDFDARSVVVDGADPSALAAAVNAAIVEAQTPVQSIEPDPTPLEDLQREAAETQVAKGAA